MIRRDYIERMIKEFIQALSRIRALKKDRRWQEAAGVLDEECRRLTGLDPKTVVRLTETELLAKLLQGEGTQSVQEKILILTALLKEAGDLAVAENHPDEGRACHLRGLHLLLNLLARGEASVHPDFVPQVEVFVATLQDSPLPMQTQALLLQHFEQTGQFAKAEDALFAMLDAGPDNPKILDFGITLYERLQNKNDRALEEGNLPRSELEAGLAELRDRRKQA